MRITKCDLCKKEINNKPINIWAGLSLNVELCEKCGAPILRFLKKHKFIKLEKSKSK